MVAAAASVGRLLDDASRRLTDAGRSTPRLDAEVLLAHVSGHSRTALLIHPEWEIAPSALGHFEALLRRRVTGEPVAYLLGHREFMGLDFEVTPEVLIPRAETEHLVELALERLARTSSPRVADVGTGSGAVAIALARHRTDATLWATDVSPGALAVARRNGERHHAPIRWVEGDLLEGVPAGLDLVVSNPPYVSEAEFAELGPGVRDYEPKSALVGGTTGLELYPALLAQAGARLRAGGWLLVEMAPWQAEAIVGMFQTAGWVECGWMADLGDRPRVAFGRTATGEEQP